MEIQKSCQSDLDAIMAVYTAARAFMAENGNPTQWPPGYPPREMIRKDIAMGHHYVFREGNEILATFILPFGIDPTYAELSGPGWLNDDPYGAIHRLAVNPKYLRRGLGSACLQAAEEIARERQIHNLRINTHSDNLPMQKTILKNGFTYCGVITVEDGTHRNVYQKELKED